MYSKGIDKSEKGINEMTAAELKVKLANALAVVAKKEKTVAKHKAQAEKMLVNMTEAEAENFKAKKFGDYSFKMEDIREAENKLRDAKRIAENWKEKLDGQNKFERVIAKEIPEAFRSLKNHLVTEWTIWDEKRKAEMLRDRETMDLKHFRGKYGYDTSAIERTHNEFIAANERESNIFIFELYNRVKLITGNVTSWGNINVTARGLNGWVTGDEGSANVETIIAGGYNVQRLHYRVLVK